MFGSLAGSVAARARRRPFRQAVAAAGALLLASLALGPILGPADAVSRAVEAQVLPIVSVTLSSDDELVAQTESQTAVVDYGHRPIGLAGVTVDHQGDRVKLVPRPGRADVVDGGSLVGIDLVIASENGAQTQAKTAGFEIAAERVLMSVDLRDYLRADDPGRNGSGWDAGLDVIFDRPLTGDHYLVVSERDGNSTLRLTALDESAVPFAAGRPISIEPPYGWNTGYAPGDHTPVEAFHLTVIDVDELLAAASPRDTADRPTEIAGLRLETGDGADLDVSVFVDEDTAAAIADLPPPAEPTMGESASAGDEADGFRAAPDRAAPANPPTVTALGSVYSGHDGGSGCPTARPFIEAEHGDPVTYCVTVTNPSPEPLADLSVTAPVLPVAFTEVERVDPRRLDPGESAVFFAEAMPPADEADGELDETLVTTVSISGVAVGSNQWVEAATDIMAFPAEAETTVGSGPS